MDSTLEFEKRRNIPVKYDRELVATTVSAVSRIQEIKTKREKAFYRARMLASAPASLRSDALEVLSGTHLLGKDRNSELVLKAKAAAEIKAKKKERRRLEKVEQQVEEMQQDLEMDAEEAEEQVEEQREKDQGQGSGHTQEEQAVIAVCSHAGWRGHVDGDADGLDLPIHRQVQRISTVCIVVSSVPIGQCMHVATVGDLTFCMDLGNTTTLALRAWSCCRSRSDETS